MENKEEKYFDEENKEITKLSIDELKDLFSDITARGQSVLAIRKCVPARKGEKGIIILKEIKESLEKEASQEGLYVISVGGTVNKEAEPVDRIDVGDVIGTKGNIEFEAFVRKGYQLLLIDHYNVPVKLHKPDWGKNTMITHSKGKIDVGN